MGCDCGKFSLSEMEWFVPSLTGEVGAEELQTLLEGMAAVRGVRVKLRDKTVRVGFDADHIGIGQLKEEMNRAGFQVVLAGL